LKPHQKKQWCIPPHENADFVAHMEDILAVYRRPYDARLPVVNMDEQPVQMLSDKREPLPTAPGRPAREDYEYGREGVASVFMFTEPLGGWRRVSARERRTAVDWAEEMRTLLERDYPEAGKVVLVCDNLNTHKIASFYEAFEPEVARALVERLEIHYTPKHGSWLNIAECELSILTRQCLDRRIGGLKTLRRESRVWQKQRNAAQKGIDWRFTTDDARIKLKHLYPKILV
jgi:hypothetical protein